MTVLFILQEIVDLVPPGFLLDFDCGAVPGNVLDVDSQCFTKSQSSSGAERKKHPSFFPGSSNDAGYYIACERWLFWVLHDGQVD
jgi:hypothetical protein